jgi:hypothetical protein
MSSSAVSIGNKRQCRIQRNCLRFAEAADGKAAQFGDMPERAQRFGEVAGERTNISALPDRRFEIGVVGLARRDQAQFGDFHRARRQFRRVTGAGKRIGTAAGDLQRRIGGRPLHDTADEPG